MTVLRSSTRKGNSAGLILTTAGNDLVHTLSINRSAVTRTAVIRKIFAYNNTGGPETIQFGTRDFTAGVPLFVQYLPDILVVNGLESFWTEDDIPAVEFSVLTLALANGREGNIYLLASAAAILVSIEVEEFGS